MGPRLLMSDDIIPKFIEEVKSRECIWNPDDADYSDRYKTMVAWKGIAQALDQPEDVLKPKWKNLRDIFRREYKRLVKRFKIVDNVAKSQARWKHFEALWFLHRPEDVVFNESDNEDHEASNIEKTEEVTLDEDSLDSNPLKHFVKYEPPDQNEDAEIYLEQNLEPAPKRRKRQDDDSDFDMMYLKSLTPYFRQLDPLRKLIVRSKIQDILINEIAAQTASNNKIYKINS